VAVPGETPVTIPDVPTTATPPLLLLHTPPDPASVKAVVLPTQTTGVPVIAKELLLMSISNVVSKLLNSSLLPLWLLGRVLLLHV